MPTSLVTDPAREILARVFGFPDFRVGQREVVQAALDGFDVLAVMPTGSGKSLCFQLPALVGGGLTLVISPLIALMDDQTRQLREFGVTALSLHSGNTPQQQIEARRTIATTEQALVYLSPERLAKPEVIGWLADTGRVRRLVVDEAHCVSQWGHDFRPEYLQVRQAAQALGDVQVLAFTATADEATRADIVSRLFGRTPKVFVHGFDRPNIHLAMVAKENARKQLTDFVLARRGDSGIIYYASRRETEELAAHFATLGVTALPYHAGLDSRTRQEHQRRFLQEDGLVMCATIAFGMGIDKPDVRFVCHASLPKNIEGYYQEIGRAGRDGLPASTLMLYGLDDIRLRRVQIMESEAPESQKIVDNQRLAALLALCETPRCRRQTLLAYFGEQSPACGNCDLCQSGCAVCDGTVDAQKAMSAMVRTGQRFGSEHIISVLRGKLTDAIARLDHDALPTFGVGKEQSARYWQALLRQLIGAGLVSMDLTAYGSFVVTPEGWEVLRGQRTVEVRAGLGERTSRGARAKRARGADAPGGVLLDALKQLRFSLAKELGVPAYVVFSDKSLLDMCARLPSDEVEMAEVFGVGEAKLAKYGQAFLEVIDAHRHEPTTNLEAVADLDWVAKAVHEALLSAQSWDELQANLEGADLIYQPRGGGLCLNRVSSGEPVAKASEVGPGYKELIRRFQSGYPGHPHAWLVEKVLAQEAADGRD